MTETNSFKRWFQNKCTVRETAYVKTFSKDSQRLTAQMKDSVVFIHEACNQTYGQGDRIFKIG
jgi:hypothetical protein